MSNICRFTTPASQDLEAILDYMAEVNSIDIAEEFLARVNKKCQTLASFPGLGKKREELFPSLRSFPIDSYLIFYRPIPEGIEILRIVSGYRDLEALFEEDRGT
jgi:toxin ParE1/3/4